MIAIIFAAATALPARPPDGTYVYAVARQGADIGNSTVSFKTSGSTITVQERADISVVQADTTTELDAGTLQETAFSGSAPQQGSFSATFGGSGVTLHSGGASIPLQPVGGRPIILTDGLISPAALLPAIVHATGAKTFTVAAMNGGKAYAATVSPIATKPPSNIPQSDAGIALTYAGSTATLWYNPQTFVLDLLQNPALSVEVRLQR